MTEPVFMSGHLEWFIYLFITRECKRPLSFAFAFALSFSFPFSFALQTQSEHFGGEEYLVYITCILFMRSYSAEQITPQMRKARGM